MNELLTVSDIAAQAGRSVTTIHRWVEEGRLNPAFRLRRTNQLLFSSEHVDYVLPRLLEIAANNPRSRKTA